MNIDEKGKYLRKTNKSGCISINYAYIGKDDEEIIKYENNNVSGSFSYERNNK